MPIAPLGDFFCQTLELSWKRRNTASQIASKSALPVSKEEMQPTTTKSTGAWNFLREYDLVRIGAAACFSALISVPTGIWWFPWVDRLVKSRWPKIPEGSFNFVMIKTIAEGVLIGPVYTAGYFVVVSAIKGGNEWLTLGARLKRDFWATLAGDEIWWLFIAPLNYKFIPVNRQVIFAGFGGVSELMAFSWIQHWGLFTDSKEPEKKVLAWPSDSSTNTAAA